jgi:hypothetical protein
MIMLEEIFKYLASDRWNYLAYTIPITVICLWFYIKNKGAIVKGLINLITWSRPSLEVNGKSDTKKVAAFSILIFAYLPCRWFYTFRVSDPLHLLYGLAMDILAVLIILGIIQFKDIIDFKNGKSNDDTDKKQPAE